MSAAAGPRVWRVWSASVLAAIAFALPGAETPVARAKSADERIAFYRGRVGGPGTYPAYAQLGLACLDKFRETGQAKYHTQALANLRQSLQYQRNFEALLGLALALSERHQFKEALPYAEEAFGAMPSNLAAAGALFDIRLGLGRIAEAEAGLNALLAASAAQREAASPQAEFQMESRLAALREYRGDKAGALEAMRRAGEAALRGLSTGVAAWAEVRAGSLQLQLCDAAGARAAYERALVLMPKFDFATEHLAEWHAAQGQWKEAAKLFRQLLMSRPTTPNREAVAEAYRALGQRRAALREERRALSELRQDARDGAQDVFRPLALSLLERDASVAEGLEWAQRDWAVRQDALAADTLAWGWFRNGRIEEALRFSGEALKSGNQDAGLLLRAGIIHACAGRAGQGRDLLQQALSCPLRFGARERRLASEGAKLLRETPS